MASHARNEEISRFSEQLALMLAASVPILDALEISVKTSEPGLAKTLQSVHDEVEKGNPLSAALAGYRETFGPTYIVMIKVGEASGTLVQVLRSLAESSRKAGETGSRVKAALVYPGALVLSSLTMVFFLVSYMLPNFLKVVPGSENDLPLLTRVVMTVFTSPLVTIGIPILGACLVIFVVAARKSPEKQQKIRAVLLRTPGLGPILERLAVIRVCENMALLREGGLDLYRSLGYLVSETTGSPRLDAGLNSLRAGISGGLTLGESMAGETIFPKVLTLLVNSGEESGDLDRSLRQYAKMSDAEVSHKIENLVTLIEPLTMAFMGFVIGTILIATFLPTYELMMNI